MTEVGEKWAATLGRHPNNWSLAVKEAEFYIRAFSAEVEERARNAESFNSRRDAVARFGWAFTSLITELLGPREVGAG